MKKISAFTALFAALFMTSCSRDTTATVIYTDVPSPLTKMTYSESLPPETYSEYMATYSETSETSSESYHFPELRDGVAADTAVTAPPAVSPENAPLPERDTAVALPSDSAADIHETKPPEETAETVVCGSEMTETTSEIPETTETVPAVTLDIPKADTAGDYEKVSADTAPSDRETGVKAETEKESQRE